MKNIIIGITILLLVVVGLPVLFYHYLVDDATKEFDKNILESNIESIKENFADSMTDFSSLSAINDGFIDVLNDSGLLAFFGDEYKLDINWEDIEQLVPIAENVPKLLSGNIDEFSYDGDNGVAYVKNQGDYIEQCRDMHNILIDAGFVMEDGQDPSEFSSEYGVWQRYNYILSEDRSVFVFLYATEPLYEETRNLMVEISTGRKLW